MLLDGRPERLVRDVDAELLGELVEHVRLQLLAEVVHAVLVLLERHVGELAEEVRVLDDVHPLQMLLETAGDGAGLGGELGVEEIEAALERALHEAASVMAGAAGHVVCSHLGRGAARGAQANGEAPGQVEQDLRHKVTGVSKGALAFVLCLLDEVVVGLLQQVFKEDQVL